MCKYMVPLDPNMLISTFHEFWSIPYCPARTPKFIILGATFLRQKLWKLNPIAVDDRSQHTLWIWIRLSSCSHPWSYIWTFSLTSIDSNKVDDFQITIEIGKKNCEGFPVHIHNCLEFVSHLYMITPRYVLPDWLQEKF